MAEISVIDDIRLCGTTRSGSVFDRIKSELFLASTADTERHDARSEGGIL